METFLRPAVVSIVCQKSGMQPDVCAAAPPNEGDPSETLNCPLARPPARTLPQSPHDYHMTSLTGPPCVSIRLV